MTCFAVTREATFTMPCGGGARLWTNAANEYLPQSLSSVAFFFLLALGEGFSLVHGAVVRQMCPGGLCQSTEQASSVINERSNMYACHPVYPFNISSARVATSRTALLARSCGVCVRAGGSSRGGGGAAAVGRATRIHAN